MTYMGKWEKKIIQGAWNEAINEPSRKQAKFELLQVALSGAAPTIKGRLVVTRSQYAEHIFEEHVCCGYNCEKEL